MQKAAQREINERRFMEDILTQATWQNDWH